MATTTHYDLLGLSSTATANEIRDARRAVLVAAHPDRAADAADRERREVLCSAVNAAADLLLDPKARRAYDRRVGVARRIGLPVALLPVRRATRRVASPVLDTRLGQWLLLAFLAALMGVLELGVVGTGLAVASAALLLSVPGEPTPLSDVEQLLRSVVRLSQGPGARLGRAAVASVTSSLRERAAEAGMSPPVSTPRAGGASRPSDDEAA